MLFQCWNKVISTWKQHCFINEILTLFQCWNPDVSALISWQCFNFLKQPCFNVVSTLKYEVAQRTLNSIQSINESNHLNGMSDCIGWCLDWQCDGGLSSSDVWTECVIDDVLGGDVWTECMTVDVDVGDCRLGRVYCPVSTLSAMWDSHVKGNGIGCLWLQHRRWLVSHRQ